MASVPPFTGQRPGFFVFKTMGYWRVYEWDGTLGNIAPWGIQNLKWFVMTTNGTNSLLLTYFTVPFVDNVVRRLWNAGYRPGRSGYVLKLAYPHRTHSLGSHRQRLVTNRNTKPLEYPGTMRDNGFTEGQQRSGVSDMNKRIESAKYEAVLCNAHRRSAQALENAVAHENRMMKNTTLQVVYSADGTASVEVV